ncbi:Cu(I)/Ag(I) efflux system membrane protein CusA/SilA [Thiogranum longum]|uniref:Cu(I)/Ag(I) efflux system membrane protein CusA/SilA n=1 Tax=Thiogranum longum TaxID=1537524 RepID=A0A4V2PGU6_9GAMM|nr:CusA/CzcA family heavy metal efflux RND transporter [Thiogranum longum]TCK18216.1 Cu(I)/Ag(I) efflux system membrane protein CusA/SilA [Thiogranum longum]
MIAALIRWSVRNRLLVLLAAALLSAWGVYSVRTIPLDAIPDLSDVQVIIRTSYSGQAPQVVEDQITYPLSTAMLSVPGAVAVRGYSFFGDSYVYVIFSDDTDLYWARSRVLEYLSQVTDQLPRGAQPRLGPDATGVGWIYQYALLDRTGKHDLSELRSLQDWFLKYELQTVPGVSEVAAIGGMVKQYQVVIDPDRLRGYYLTLANVKRAIEESNAEISGSSLEIAEAEYMIRFKGYVKNKEDIGVTSVPTIRRRLSISSVLLDDVVHSIRIGPAMRRGVADLNGEGEVVGGIIVMRSGENALTTIKAVKEKLDQLERSLPDGVELVETYDRSALINGAVSNLGQRLVEEFLVVVVVCALFLLHLRSSLVILISLPVGILTAFVIMHLQGINANIMSLGGIAIAIGAMVDATIVMIENVHKHLERAEARGIGRLQAIQDAAVEVGSPLFFSLLIITLSFLPVFTLEAQEARLFSPLAYTKTYAMAAAAGLSITLVPALMAFLIRGKVRPEEYNPINRGLIAAYRPLIRWALARPWLTIGLACLLVVTMLWPLNRLGTEFMPEMDEGDILYMPTTLPGISVGKARELLQQTDRLIRTLPEVESVFGKVGRAETATDPAPLTMLETVIRLKPEEQWRPGMSMDKIRAELDARVQVPSLHNAWLMPIRTRIDMQSTGINTPVGIKIAGPDLAGIQSLGEQVENVLLKVPGTRTVLSDRAAGARYIDVDIDRQAAGHYGLSIAEIEEAANIAVAGQNVTYTVEGRERYPVNLRYPRVWRDSITKLKELPLVVTEDTQIQLQDLAEIRITDGPPLIKSENGRINGWVYITIDGRDIGSYVAAARQALQQQLDLPAGYTLNWVGQYQYLQRAAQRLSYIIPLTLFIIFILLYLSFRTLSEALMVMLSVPLALVGGVWLLWLLDFHLSVAVAVGFIALAGVAAEFGVVMLVYLREAISRNQPINEAELRSAVIEGAVLRVRPKAMTAAVIIAGLMPIMLGGGAGSEVMQRIAAPMIGGMVTAPLVSMLLLPVMYFLWYRNKLTGKPVRQAADA